MAITFNPFSGNFDFWNALQGAYNISTQPQITLAAAKGGLDIRAGDLAASTDFLSFKNDAGTTTYLACDQQNLDIGVHVLPTVDNTWDLGTAGNSFRDAYIDRTVYLDNNFGTSIQWPATYDIVDETDVKLMVGGGGTDDGTFRINFYPKVAGVIDAGSHIVDINFEHVGLFAAPGASNRLSIRNVIDSESSNAYGDIQFLIGSSGVLASSTGVSFATQLTGTGAASVHFNTNFINRAGGFRFAVTPTAPAAFTLMRITGAADTSLGIGFGKETQTTNDTFFQFELPTGMIARSAATVGSICRFSGATSYNPGTGGADVHANVIIDAPTFNTNTPFMACNLYIPSAPTGGTNNLAVFIDGGIIRADDAVWVNQRYDIMKMANIMGLM